MLNWVRSAVSAPLNTVKFISLFMDLHYYKFQSVCFLSLCITEISNNLKGRKTSCNCINKHNFCCSYCGRGITLMVNQGIRGWVSCFCESICIGNPTDVVNPWFCMSIVLRLCSTHVLGFFVLDKKLTKQNG